MKGRRGRRQGRRAPLIHIPGYATVRSVVSTANVSPGVDCMAVITASSLCWQHDGNYRGLNLKKDKPISHMTTTDNLSISEKARC